MRPLGSVKDSPRFLHRETVAAFVAHVRIVERLIYQIKAATPAEMYRLMGDAEEALHTADRVLCSLPDEVLGIGGEKHLAAAAGR